MNHSKILIKCIDALKGDEPDLSYVRGMLETLVDMQEETPKFLDASFATNAVSMEGGKGKITAPAPMDEGGLLNAKAAALMDKMPPLQLE